MSNKMSHQKNHEKGQQYEKFIRDFIIQNLHRNAYLWNECPETILIQNNLIESHNHMRLLRKDLRDGNLHHHKDVGIDVIQCEGNETNCETDDCPDSPEKPIKCSIVQCKNGYNTGVTMHHLAGIMTRAAFIRDIAAYVYYTNKLSSHIRSALQSSPYVSSIDCSKSVDALTNLEQENKIYFVKLPMANQDYEQDIIQSNMTPYTYQTEAVHKFREYFQTNNRGILSLPCGCGKTYTSFMIANEYDHIIIMSPLREFASQNLKRYIEYGFDASKTLLVDMDGIRDLDTIKAFINGNEKLLISCTYTSMDLITQCLDLFRNALFIVDEFHNLSKVNISQAEDPIFQLLMSEHKILFMSATPRIYDIEYDDNNLLDMECLFGDVVYNMNMTDAISKKYICDYRIWLPAVHENNSELDKELSIYDIDNGLKNRCKFLYSCISNNGSRKCIIYCTDTNDMKKMMECMKTLNDFYIMNIQMASISCEDSEKQRKESLRQFSEENDKIHLLFNIKILNECIDIPACDSVYISYPPKNKITTIQRICRANRIDKNNSYKTANIYIWCDEYEDILQTLSSIKEYDVMLKNKIKLNVVDFYQTKEDKEIELVKNDKVLLSHCIVGVKEFRAISWEEKLQMVTNYVKANNKLPSCSSKTLSTKQLGCWLIANKKNYNKKIYMFKKTHNVELWEQFIKDYEELLKSPNDKWKINLEILDEYIKKYDKLPSSESKEEDTCKLGQWVLTQKANYKNKEHGMKNQETLQIWEEYIEKHSHLFNDHEEKWYSYLETLDAYILQYNKLPSLTDKDPKIKKLGKWWSDQNYRYKKETCIMKSRHFRDRWKEFTQKHHVHFRTNLEIWKDRLTDVKAYVDTNKKLPYLTDTNSDIKKLAKWLYHQVENYKYKKEGLENEELRRIWEDFVQKYPDKKFMSPEEYWLQTYNKLVIYVNDNNRLPRQNNTDKEQTELSQWMKRQNNNYKHKVEVMKKDDVRLHWEQFKTKNSHLFS